MKLYFEVNYTEFANRVQQSQRDLKSHRGGGNSRQDTSTYIYTRDLGPSPGGKSKEGASQYLNLNTAHWTSFVPMQPHPWIYPPEGPKPCRFSGSIPQAAGLSVRKITTHMPATERKPRDQSASSKPVQSPEWLVWGQFHPYLTEKPYKACRHSPPWLPFRGQPCFLRRHGFFTGKKAHGQRAEGNSWGGS